MNLTTVIQEGIEQNFPSYYNKFTLLFQSSKMEKDYRNDSQKKNRFQLRIILLMLSLFSLGVLIWRIAIDGTFLITTGISTIINMLGYIVVRKYPFQCIEMTITSFSIFNQIMYDLLLSNSNAMSNKNIVLGEFFITITICIYFRTRILLLDCSLVLTTRIIHLIFLTNIYEEINITSISFMIICQVSVVFFYFFQSEKNAREKYLLRNSHNQWAEIIDKVLPVNIIISKFNQRTCEIILGSCNSMCSRIFKIKDNESYNSMLVKMKVGSSHAENAQTLRDYVLNKHFSVSEGVNRSRNKDKDKSTANHSMNEIDNQLKSILALGQSSSKKRQTDEILQNHSNLNNNDDKAKQFSIKSLNNLNASHNNNANSNINNNNSTQNQQKFNQGGSATDYYNRVESLIGYYREKEFINYKKYKIKIYTVQGDNQSSLIISIEDKSHKSTLKFQKDLYSDTNHVFQKTLTHFQILVKKAMTSLNEVSSKYIPTLVLYNTLLLNMQIHNIKDYLQYIQGQYSSKQNKEKEDDKIGSHGKIFSRSANKFFTIETLGLAEMLTQLEKLMKKVCNDKQLQFILINETPEDQVIITDKNRLYRILINYISNSISNTSKGYVQLKVSNTSSLGLQTIKFQIIDSGKGISVKQASSSGTSIANGTEFKSNVLSDEDALGAPKAKLKQSINIIGFTNAINQATNQEKEKEKKIQFNISNSQGASKLNNNNTNNLEESAAIESSIMNLTQENRNSNINSVYTTPQNPQLGLGIGMPISKFLVNKLGPGFPKVFSKPGVGTNVTFEVYQDLKVVQSANQKQVPNNQPFLASQQRRHKNSSFSMFYNNNLSNNIPLQLNGMANSTVILSNNINKETNLSSNNPALNQKEALNSSGNMQSGINMNLFINLNSNNAANPSPSPHNQGSNSKESQGNLHKQSSSSGSNDYSINQGLSELKSRNPFLPQIFLDAQENIDEEALEFQNLGGNCYKMISADEIGLNIQKSDVYMNSNLGSKFELNENVPFLQGSSFIPIITGHHSNKKLSFIQAPISNQTNNSVTTASFANLQNHSQLFPFTINNNELILQQQFINFGSKVNMNVSSNIQNINNVSNNNNSSMGSLPKLDENASQGSQYNQRELTNHTHNAQQLQPLSLGNIKLGAPQQKAETPRKQHRKQSEYGGAYDKKIFRSSPDFLDPNNGPGSSENAAGTSQFAFPPQMIAPQQNLQNNVFANIHLFSDPSSHQSSHPQTHQNNVSKFNPSQQQLEEQYIQQQMYLANLANEINKIFSAQNGNQQGYQGRKLRQKSSFNLIFDQKTQMIEDPESIIANTYNQGTQYGSKENNIYNETHPQIGSNFQNDVGSQTNILISSSQSPVKIHSGQNILMNESASNSNIQQQQSQFNQLPQQQLQQNQSSLSPYEIKNKQLSQLSPNSPSAIFTQQQQQQPQSRSHQSSYQEHLAVNSDPQATDSLQNALFGSREKSVSIKLQVHQERNSSILQREKEISGGSGNKSQTNRGYRISIGCANDLNKDESRN